MPLTFKSYVTLLSTDPEQLSEEQLDEIFGKFFGGSPAERAEKVGKLKAQKSELERRRDLEKERLKKKLSRAADEKFAAARRANDPHAGLERVGSSYMRPSAVTSAQAQGRAKELAWGDR